MILVLAILGYLLVTSFLFGFTCGLHIELRRQHVLVCRTTSTVELILMFAQEVGALLLSWALGNFAFAAAYAGAIVLSEVALTRRRNRWTLRETYRRWRQHRDHEDDCEYGPRERRDRARPRLEWRKISIRPAFAPT